MRTMMYSNHNLVRKLLFKIKLAVIHRHTSRTRHIQYGHANTNQSDGTTANKRNAKQKRNKEKWTYLFGMKCKYWLVSAGRVLRIRYCAKLERKGIHIISLACLAFICVCALSVELLLVVCMFHQLFCFFFASPACLFYGLYVLPWYVNHKPSHREQKTAIGWKWKIEWISCTCTFVYMSISICFNRQFRLWCNFSSWQLKWSDPFHIKDIGCLILIFLRCSVMFK